MKAAGEYHRSPHRGGTGFSKSVRLVGIFFKNSLLVEMEYRANFAASVLMSVFWTAFALLGLQIFFHHRDFVGGWSYHEALLVVGFYTLFNGLIEAVLQPNLVRVVEQVRLGTFDFVLVKPVNSQFMATFRNLAVWRLADVLVGIAVCLYGLVGLRLVPRAPDVALFALFLVNGSVILYSIWLAMMTTCFWFVRIDNITELFLAVYETGRFPVTVYPGWMRGLLTFVVPVAFITTFPAAAVLGRAGWPLAFVSTVIAAVFFGLSAWLWHYAVRHYSSASS